MTPEAQRIAIAEACGWTTKHRGLWVERLQTYAALPDYLNDLNAMHSAEDDIPIELEGEYWKRLCHLNIGLSHLPHHRAEAFLKTLDLWKP